MANDAFHRMVSLMSKDISRMREEDIDRLMEENSRLNRENIEATFKWHEAEGKYALIYYKIDYWQYLIKTIAVCISVSIIALQGLYISLEFAIILSDWWVAFAGSQGALIIVQLTILLLLKSVGKTLREYDSMYWRRTSDEQRTSQSGSPTGQNRISEEVGHIKPPSPSSSDI